MQEGGSDKVPKSEKMKIHKLGETPEGKAASVDAKLAETSIAPGSALRVSTDHTRPLFCWE